jgi:glycosyltransferase involved in cell wall biosynthesis
MLAMGQLGADFYRSVLSAAVSVHEFAYYDVSDTDILTFDSQGSVSSQQSTSNDQPSTSYRFLYVGQLIHRKGVDRLLRALAAVSDRGWTLDLVGDGKLRARLEFLADQLGISSQLKWHGNLPSSKLGTFYQSADCLVLPSRWDGWGMTVNEALRFGCDILATETCGAAAAVPQSARLPKHTGLWTQFLETKMRAGVLAPEARAANQQLAHSLSGETGAARLKAILEG